MQVVNPARIACGISVSPLGMKKAAWRASLARFLAICWYVSRTKQKLPMFKKFPGDNVLVQIVLLARSVPLA